MRKIWNSNIRRMVAALSIIMTVLVVGGTVSPTKSAPMPKPPFKIGHLNPFSGVGAHGSKFNRMGFEMALEEVGYKVDGREIQVLYEDTEGLTSTAVTKARKLVEKDKVHILYGSWYMDQAKAQLAYLKPMGFPMVIPMGASMATLVPFPNAIGFSYTNENSTVPMARYAYEKLGYRRVILSGSDYSWGHDIVEAFAEAFKRAGGTVVDKIFVPLATMDMGPYLDKLNARAPEADFFWELVVSADGVRLHRQFFEHGLQKIIPRFSGSSSLATTLLDEVGLAGVGATIGFDWVPEIDRPTAREFVRKFKEKYGVEADWHAANGYQGAKNFVTLLKTYQGKLEDREALLKALVGIKVPEKDNILREGFLTFDPKYRSAIVDIYICKIEEVGGKPKRKIIDVIKGNPPKMLKGFGIE